MGIQNLLKALKPITEVTHISCLRGKRVAVDGYCWLHKAVYGCALELCIHQTGSDVWIKYCLSYLELLFHHDIKVTMVFDGAELPAKAKTEQERSENRQKNLQLGRECYDKRDFKNARNYFARAIDITPLMAAEFIQVLKSLHPEVKCIVAPFEADAQLAYLCRNHLVDAVISEDSDCIVYGCQEIVFKLNPRDGSCERIITADIFSKFIDSSFDLRSFTPEMFLSMCILSGCDYLDSLPGVGLKTSYKLMQKHRDGNNVLKALRLDGQIPIVPVKSEASFSSSNLLEYELKYHEAWCTFHHQVVYDPVRSRMINLTTIEETRLPSSIREVYSSLLIDLQETTTSSSSNQRAISLPFVGNIASDEIAKGIAEGKVDPVSKIPFQLRPSSYTTGKSHNDTKKTPHPFKRSLSDSVAAKGKFPKLSSNIPPPRHENPFQLYRKQTFTTPGTTTTTTTTAIDSFNSTPYSSATTTESRSKSAPTFLSPWMKDNQNYLDEFFPAKYSIFKNYSPIIDDNADNNNKDGNRKNDSVMDKENLEEVEINRLTSLFGATCSPIKANRRSNDNEEKKETNNDDTLLLKQQQSSSRDDQWGKEALDKFNFDFYAHYEESPLSPTKMGPFSTTSSPSSGGTLKSDLNNGGTENSVRFEEVEGEGSIISATKCLDSYIASRTTTVTNHRIISSSRISTSSTGSSKLNSFASTTATTATTTASSGSKKSSNSIKRYFSINTAKPDVSLSNLHSQKKEVAKEKLKTIDLTEESAAPSSTTISRKDNFFERFAMK